MKKLIAMLGAVVAAVTSAWAATPVAVWDGDFNVTTKGDVTLDVQGNTVAEDGSTVTIKDDASVGVRFKWATGRDGYTIIAKVRTIKSSSSVQALVCGGNGGNRTGVTLQTDGNTKGIWDNANWYNASYVQKQGALTLVEDSDTNYIAARHKSSNNGLCGTYLFQNSGSGWASVYEASGCRSAYDASAYKDVALGGPVTASNNFKGAAGMVIEKVAIFHAHLTADEIAAFEFVDPISDYTRWSANPAVLTWAKTASGAQNFHEGPWKLFNIETGVDGDQVTGSNIPGQTANITPWHVFSTSDNMKYVAPGYVLRLASKYPGVNLNATFTDLTFGGLIVEPYAGGYTFNSDGTRQTALGDNRTENGVETWYEIHEDLTFNRQGPFTLYGTLNFDVAKGKTLDLNSARTGQTLTLDAATHGCIKLHGAGKLKVHNLNASGAVTLDYTDVDLTREDAYVTGTITVGAATTIKLPAGVKIGDSIKLATTISGVVDSAKVLIDGVADDSIEWTISNGSLVAIEATDTVKIGDTNYVSLRKALDVASDGTVIELLKDIASRDETIPAGVTIELAGHAISGALDIKAGAVITDGGVAKIDGIATSFDATFNDTEHPTAFKFSEVSGVTLQYDEIDGNRIPTFVNTDPISKNTGITLRKHPYFNGIPASWFNNTEEITLAVVGKMTEATRTTFIHIGKSTDNGYGLLLATGDKKDEVIVAWNHGTTVTEITRMNVANAATSRHVYIVTKKDVDTKTTFTVYLDGMKWKTLVIDRFTIVGGVQVGSDFGGLIYNLAASNVNHYSNVTADVGLINAIRLYDRVITPAEIAQYSAAAEYPYTSTSGASARTVAGEENWISTDAWSNTAAGETEPTSGNAPGEGSVTVTMSAESTITVNLEADATCETLTLQGEAVSFVADGEGAIIPTAATISTPVTVVPGALDLSKANTTIVGDGKIVADYSGYDVASILAEKTVYVTGEIDQQAEGVVTLVKPTHTYRTVGDLAYNATTHQYGFTVTPVMVNVTIPTVANMTATVTSGSSTFAITEGVASIPGGVDITVTYAPATGYHTVEGAVTTVTASGVTAETVIDASGITAVEINMYTVQVMQVENVIATVTIGTGTPAVVTDASVQVSHGSSFRVDYAATEGYKLVAIEGDASGLVTENYHYATVTSNMGEYTLHFTVSRIVPTATVATMAEEDMPADPKLDSAYVFTTGTYGETYADWHADFEVTIDGEIAADTVMLYGQYGDYPWTGFYLGAMTEESKVYLMEKYDANLTCAEVFDNVGTFKCGVINKAAANIGKMLTVKLIITDGTETIDLVTQTCELGEPQATDLPGASELPEGVSKDDYNTWAAANGITSGTTAADATTAATAFVMGVTVGEDQTLAQAAEAKADNLLKEVAMTDSTDFAAELQDGELSAETVAAFEAAHPGLTIGLVEAEEITAVEGKSAFYKLSITIKK